MVALEIGVSVGRGVVRARTVGVAELAEKFQTEGTKKRNATNAATLAPIHNRISKLNDSWKNRFMSNKKCPGHERSTLTVVV